MTAAIRPAAVAGSWYPADARRLAADVDACVGRTAMAPLPSAPRALVAPHAGLMYSGPVAAYAYAALRGHTYRAVVIVGPSHYVAFKGVAVWPAGAWDTPFGAVAVDATLAAAIRQASPEVIEHPAAHGREHSLEMQLPFIARMLPGVPIVPMVMGEQVRTTIEPFADALARAVAAAEAESAAPGRVLLVASSDLSHYQRAEVAWAMDDVVLRHVESLDADGLMRALEREPRHACGGGPMVAVLRAAQRLGAHQAKVLRYADSGDVSGDKSAVVGYVAASIT